MNPEKTFTRREVLQAGFATISGSIGAFELVKHGKANVTKGQQREGEFKATHPSIPTKQEYNAAQKTLTPDSDPTSSSPDPKAIETIKLYQEMQDADGGLINQGITEAIGGGISGGIGALGLATIYEAIKSLYQESTD